MQPAPDVKRGPGGRPAGGGGWAVKCDAGQAWAAADIRRAVEIAAAPAAAGLKAVDPSRLVVDGGGSLRLAAAQGGRVGGAAVGRWASYQSDVRGREAKRGVVRGRRKALYLDVLIRRVVVDGTSPTSLDEDIGVRNGRCQQAVMAELRRYAELFRPRAAVVARQ